MKKKKKTGLQIHGGKKGGLVGMDSFLSVFLLLFCFVFIVVVNLRF